MTRFTYTRSDMHIFRYLRSVLAIPAVYNLWWNLVAGPASAKLLVRGYVQPRVGARILEIGCGPGTIVGYLPQVEYLGFDLSSEYIKKAKRRFPKAQFLCERVSEFSLGKQGGFDAVLALGVLHHLDDREAKQLFQIAYDALKSGGKLVTVDGVFTNDQSGAARWLLTRDRGQFVRNQAEYVNIASRVFTNVRASVRNDLLRIPYTHLILECFRG